MLPELYSLRQVAGYIDANLRHNNSGVPTRSSVLSYIYPRQIKNIQCRRVKVGIYLTLPYLNLIGILKATWPVGNRSHRAQVLLTCQGSLMYRVPDVCPMRVEPGLELCNSCSGDHFRRKTVPIVDCTHAQHLSSWSRLRSRLLNLPWVTPSAFRWSEREEVLHCQIDPSMENLVNLNHVSMASSVKKYIDRLYFRL